MQLSLFKKCSKCGETKLRTYFNNDKRYADGLLCWCKDCMRKHRKNWEEAHKNKRKEYFKQWHIDHLEQNHDRNNAWCRERWHNDTEYRKRKNKQSALKMAKRRMMIENSDNSLTLKQWNALCAKYDYRCLACGQQKPLTIDHIIPLSRGGSNSIDNVQPLCRLCNGKKSTKTIDYRK